VKSCVERKIFLNLCFQTNAVKFQLYRLCSILCNSHILRRCFRFSFVTFSTIRSAAPAEFSFPHFIAVLFFICSRMTQGVMPMEWTTPQHEEIDLNCEISSYANAEL